MLPGFEPRDATVDERGDAHDVQTKDGAGQPDAVVMTTAPSRTGSVMLGAPLFALCLLALAATFLPYDTYRARFGNLANTCGDISLLPRALRPEVHAACAGISTNAWHGLFGWLSAVVAVAAGTVVMLVSLTAVRAGRPVAHIPLAVPTAIGLALLLAVGAGLYVPDTNYHGERIRTSSASVTTGHSWGYWVEFAALTLAMVVAITLVRRQWAASTPEHGVAWAGTDTSRIAGRLDRSSPTPRRSRTGRWPSAGSTQGSAARPGRPTPEP